MKTLLLLLTLLLLGCNTEAGGCRARNHTFNRYDYDAVEIDPEFLNHGQEMEYILSGIESWHKAIPEHANEIVIGQNTQGKNILKVIRESGPSPVSETIIDGETIEVIVFGVFDPHTKIIRIWPENKNPNIIKKTIAHEYGHALGSSHLPLTANPDATMYPIINDNPGCIISQDIQSVCLARVCNSYTYEVCF